MKFYFVSRSDYREKENTNFKEKLQTILEVFT